MARDVNPTDTRSSAQDTERSAASDTRSPEVAALLDKVKQLLEEGGPEKALHAISRGKVDSPWVVNATAVCVLRLGETKRAVGLFHTLVSGPGMTLRSDAPTVFKVNYAAALLVDSGPIACQGVLCLIDDEQHPGVQQLRAAIQKWKQSLSFWQKFQWYTGDQPNRPLTLDFPLGAID